jgi:hypothetical protein
MTNVNPPFFIVGTGRCGTQMLRNILSSWNRVAILPESHFIIPLYDKYGLNTISVDVFLEVVDNVYGSNGEEWVKTIIRSAEKNYSTYQADFVDYVFRRSIHGNIKDYTEAFFRFLYGDDFFFGDKTPHYGTNLSIIRRIFPDAKIIHLVRDGVDCAHSMLGHPGFIKYINGNVAPQDLDRTMYHGGQLHFSIEPPSMLQAVEFWERVMKRILVEIHASGSDNVQQVRYEDLLFHPKHEIARIAGFLGIENDARALSKAFTIPRPFPERHQVRKLKRDEYEKYFEMVRPTMTQLGYPYEVDIQRSFWGQLHELYRGRYAYLSNITKQLKKQ